ncbi:DUF6232 family protein [Paraburkholderia tropica]|uniref:DUF6232 family protein n=1 Tax=Paraburkholderia tropica TaxID=92647 RepID=UPI00158FB1D4|nr:DUF6232 family protein [Paraburkholderia tropica]
MKSEPELGEISGSAPTEKLFLDLGDVKVTSARFVVPGQTFAMSGVTSVKHWRTPRKWIFGAVLLVIGFPGLLASAGAVGQEKSIGPLLIGLVMPVLGAYLLWRGRPHSQVRLQSASGETKAFTSRDDALVRRIVSAISDAIVHRG